VNTWCEHWYIKIKKEKTQAIYFTRRLRVPDDVHRKTDPSFVEEEAPFRNMYMSRRE
jgi:hypothetical protein